MLPLILQLKYATVVHVTHPQGVITQHYIISHLSFDTDIVHRDLKLENVLLKSPVDPTSNKMDIKVHVHVCTYNVYVQCIRT